MKKIKIKFFGLGYKNVNQAFVTIYDSNLNIVFEGETFNNCLTLCVSENELYKLVATSFNEHINTYFYTGKNDCYSFRFPRSIINTNLNINSITLILTDYYYNNLKIERGEIILWQRQ